MSQQNQSPAGESQLTAPFALLSVEEMRRVETLAVEAGVSEAALMENAGSALAETIRKRMEPRPAIVLCGPGANGGDGYVVARKLKEAGWPVRIAAFNGAPPVTDPARMMASLVDGETAAFAPQSLAGAGLIVDALFGVGLSRALEGEAAAMAAAVNAHPAPVVAIDIPSGVDADTGAVAGEAIRAAITVTFVRKKFGHVLYPGRAYCGAVEVVDIGAPAAALAQLQPMAAESHPVYWGGALRRPGFDDHKFDRGAVAVLSGPRLATGAARLSARAALRAGAGIVTMLAGADAASEIAAHVTSVMVRTVDGPAAVSAFLEDERYKTVIVGPGGRGRRGYPQSGRRRTRLESVRRS